MADPQAEIFDTLRLGLETTRGTAVNPTRIMEQTEWDHTQYEIATIKPRQRRGMFSKFFGTATAGREKHAFTFGGDLSFNQAAELGALFIKGVTTGTGAGADKTYTFLGGPDDSGANALKSATAEWGHQGTLSATQPGFRLPFVVGDVLTLTWDKSQMEGVKFKADMHSPVGATQITAFGGSPTALTTTAMVPVQTVISIDPTTMGSTVDNHVQKAEWVLTNGWTDEDTLNGTAAAQNTFRIDRDWSLTMTRYFANDNELDRYVDKATRKIRIQNTGPVLGGSFYRARLDLYAVLDTDGYKHGATDGLYWEQLKYGPIYDSTLTSDFSFEVVTAETTIT